MSSRTNIDLVEESDRGCILVAAAVLETRMSNIFQEQFKQHNISTKLQKSIFSVLGPLGSFSSKIKLAFALGYISKKSYEDLDIIRKLRNKAAHTTSDFDFLDKKISNNIEKLNCIVPFKGGIKRYNAPKNVPKPKEAHLQVAGYVKYIKSIISLGITYLDFILECEASGVDSNEIEKTFIEEISS